MRDTVFDMPGTAWRNALSAILVQHLHLGHRSRSADDAQIALGSAVHRIKDGRPVYVVSTTRPGAVYIADLCAAQAKQYSRSPDKLDRLVAREMDKAEQIVRATIKSADPPNTGDHSHVQLGEASPRGTGCPR